MDKREAMERIAAIEEETKKLRAIVEAAEAAEEVCLLKTPKLAEPYNSLELRNRKFGGGGGLTRTRSDDKEYKFATFPDRDTADAYAKALNTLLHLRHCPGTVPPKNDNQYIIMANESCATVFLEYWKSQGLKASLLSPCFDSYESAKAALAEVGEDNIKHMFETLHGLLTTTNDEMRSTNEHSV